VCVFICVQWKSLLFCGTLPRDIGRPSPQSCRYDIKNGMLPYSLIKLSLFFFLSETVWALLCVAERRATRPNGEWGYSTRRHVLGPERPEAVSPERGVVLTDLQSSIDCQ
jgi:hypothetical protein